MMNEDGNTIYCYMRLRDKFFDDREIKEIEALPESKFGLNFPYLVIVLYLKLLCNSISRDGVIIYDQAFEESSDLSESITRRLFPWEKRDQIKQGLYILERLNLIQIIQEPEQTMLLLPAVPDNTGKATKAADRKRLERSKTDKLLAYGELNEIHLTEEEYEKLSQQTEDINKLLLRYSLLTVTKQRCGSDYEDILKFSREAGGLTDGKT